RVARMVQSDSNAGDLKAGSPRPLSFLLGTQFNDRVEISDVGTSRADGSSTSHAISAARPIRGLRQARERPRRLLDRARPFERWCPTAEGFGSEVGCWAARRGQASTTLLTLPSHRSRAKNVRTRFSDARFSDPACIRSGP